MARTIFITGASQGFGRLWVEALLKRGDNVAATSRNVEVYGDRFLPIQLDITDREQVFAAAIELLEKYGYCLSDRYATIGGLNAAL